MRISDQRQANDLIKADNHIVHIWQIPLDRPCSETGQLAGLLSDEEKARADRFRFDRDRNRFIVTRASLRTILARYSNTPASELVFGSNSFGKPFLKHPQDNPLQFNLAHSNNLGVLAVTQGRTVGVDVEFIRPVDDADKIAQMAFAESEYHALQLIPENKRLIAFFACWTRKEAYLKALGVGLSRSREFTVNVEPNVDYVEPYEHLDGERNTISWSIHTLDWLPAYIGAIAAEGTDWEFETRWV